MAVSVVIPNGPVRRIKSGKQEIECLTPAAALAWADDQLPDDARTFAQALAIVFASRRPGMRGKTLTVDLAAPANLVTVV